jgi:hypothetical protein
VKFETNINKLKRMPNNIPIEWITLFETIWIGRNDYHHLNLNVETDKNILKDIAKEKITKLFDVESRIFEFKFVGGAIHRIHPEYWQENQAGLLDAYLRFEM